MVARYLPEDRKSAPEPNPQQLEIQLRSTATSSFRYVITTSLVLHLVKFTQQKATEF